jgi:hypothetical protein
MKQLIYRCSLLGVLAPALLILAPLTLFGQTPQPTPDPFVGKFKGIAKMGAAQVDVTLETKFADGKFSGRAVTPNTEYPITSGELAGTKLTLKIGTGDKTALLTVQSVDGKLVGDWISGEQKGTVELKRVTAIEVAAADSLAGEWDAVADAQGQAFPFTLVLKVDAEKVTGSSSSQLGNSQISSGIWKEGKLTILLDGSSGAIGLVAAMVDGKLVGEYDFAGQLQGKWVAVRKK